MKKPPSTEPEPLPKNHPVRRFWRVAVWVSWTAILIPLLTLVVSAVIDPYGAFTPGGFSGGLLPTYALLVGGPIFLLGIVGLLISFVALRLCGPVVQDKHDKG